MTVFKAFVSVAKSFLVRRCNNVPFHSFLLPSDSLRPWQWHFCLCAGLVSQPRALHAVRDPSCEGWGGPGVPGTLLRSSFRLLAITPRRLLLSWLETRKGRAECMRGVRRTFLVCDPINVRGLEMKEKGKKTSLTWSSKKGSSKRGLKYTKLNRFSYLDLKERKSVAGNYWKSWYLRNK